MNLERTTEVIESNQLNKNMPNKCLLEHIKQMEAINSPLLLGCNWLLKKKKSNQSHCTPVLFSGIPGYKQVETLASAWKKNKDGREGSCQHNFSLIFIVLILCKAFVDFLCLL